MNLLARARAGRLGEDHASDDRVAVIAQGNVLTRRQLATAAERVRVTLAEAGLAPGDCVLLGATNKPAFIAGLLGTWAAGAVAFPLEPTLPLVELRALLAIGHASHILGVDPSWVAALAGRPAQALTFLEDRLFLAPTGSPAPSAPAGSALRQITSGSLGRRRHVLKSWENTVANVTAFRELLAGTEDDTVLGVVPFSHSYILHCACLLPLAIGAAMVLSEHRSPRSITDLIDRHAVTLFPANPFLCDLIARSRAGDPVRPCRLRYVVSSGGPLDARTEREVRRRFGARVVSAYGSTETGLVCARGADGQCSEETLTEGCVGQPVNGVTVSIVDDRGQPASHGSVGRIGVCGPATAACTELYDDRTIVHREQDLVFPGDRGFLDPTGGLHLVGRDDVINLGGLKVAPADVRDALRAHPAVDDAAVLGVIIAGRPAVGAVVASQATRLAEEELQRHCVPLIARHEIPKRIAIVSQLPRSILGKVRRSDLQDVLEFVDGTEERRAVVAIWSLLAPDVGLHDFHAKATRIAELNRPLRPRRAAPGSVQPPPQRCPHPIRFHGIERLSEDRERPLLLTAWHHATLLHPHGLLQVVPEVLIFTASRYAPAYTQYVTEPLEDNPLVGLLRIHKELQRRPVYLAFDGPVGLSSIRTVCLGIEMEFSMGLFGVLGANPTARLLPTSSFFLHDGSVDFWIGPELLPPSKRRELSPPAMLAELIDYFTAELRTNSPENVCFDELLHHGTERARRRQRLAAGAVGR
jgi:acyl-CoA synthetase (AMP-forming)/AMP-acid ligase II